MGGFLSGGGGFCPIPYHVVKHEKEQKGDDVCIPQSFTWNFKCERFIVDEVGFTFLYCSFRFLYSFVFHIQSHFHIWIYQT